MDDAGVGGQTAIFHAVTQFDDGGLPMAQLLVERGADLSVRVKLPGHYERPDEIVECTPLGYALRFLNESHLRAERSRSCESEEPSSESIAEFPPSPPHGSNRDHDNRLHEVHAGARVSIPKSVDTADDKRRHQAREDDVSVTPHQTTGP